MVSKSIIFLVKSFLGNFYTHLAIFSGHTVYEPPIEQVNQLLQTSFKEKGLNNPTSERISLKLLAHFYIGKYLNHFVVQLGR